MNMEKLAELLHVDEVVIAHGPKGYGLQVRLEEHWMSTTVDHEEIQKSVNGHTQPKMVGVAKKLMHLTDTLLHGVSRAAIAAQVPLPVREMARISPPRDVPDYYSIDRQVQRFADAPPAANQPLPPAAMEPAVSASMASRFHAIVAELNR